MRCVRRGEGEDLVGFGEGGGEGLFDEDVEAGVRELAATAAWWTVGTQTLAASRLRPADEQLVDGGEGGDAVVRGGFGADCRVGVDDGGELDVTGAGCFEARGRRGGGCGRRRRRR